MCHSRCCLDVVGQPSVPSGSSFFKVMMNKDFWGFLSYSDKLSVALNVIMLGGTFLIYQEDSERESETSNTSRIPWKGSSIAWGIGWSGWYSQWAFTSSNSSGSFIIELIRFMSVVRLNYEVRSLWLFLMTSNFNFGSCFEVCVSVAGPISRNCIFWACFDLRPNAYLG